MGSAKLALGLVATVCRAFVWVALVQWHHVDDKGWSAQAKLLGLPHPGVAGVLLKQFYSAVFSCNYPWELGVQPDFG